MKKVLLFFLFINLWDIPIGMSQNWLPMDKGIDCFYASGTVRNILVDSVSDKLYISGTFNQDGNCIPLRGMAQWTGTTWDSIGGATEGNVSKFGITIYNDTLCLYGNFYDVNTNFYFAKWNGNYWDTIKNGPNDVVWTYAEKDSILYMGGYFDHLGADSTFLIGKYDGTQFSGIVPYCDPPGGWVVRAMTFYQDTLYVGGYFNMLPCKTMASLGKWDGNDLQLISPEFANNGINCSIQAMAVYQGELYIGGYFVQANGYAGDYIMKYNGSTFSAVGGGLDDRVTGMRVYNGKLYVCGYFSQAGGVPATGVAMWDGTTWTSLTTDVFGGGSPFIECLNIYHDTLVIGGTFMSINGDGRMRKIAKYKYSLAGIEEKLGKTAVLVYPNPTQSQLTIEFKALKPENAVIEIKNVLGQTVYSSKRNFTGGKQKLEIDVSGLLPGVYILQLNTGDKMSAMKFVKE